jgi:uncharacterized protein (DUF433 family)
MQVNDGIWTHEAPLPEAVFHSDPEIVSGTPVFVGSRVPIASLFEYLMAGDNLDRFLDDFPSVDREKAVGALKIARVQLVEIAFARAGR